MRVGAPLGTTFVRCSVQPVNDAGRFLVEGKIAEGLRELSPENLEGGLRNGIEQSARQVGVRPQFVEGLMPLSELLALGEKLKITQRKALHAWEQHAPEMNGALDLGAENPRLDASECLERLSRESDRPLAQPLEVLAKDVGRWRQLLDVCGQRLDQGGLVERVRRERLLRNAAIFVAMAAIGAMACSFAFDVWSARERVGAALAAADGCAVLSVAPSDLAKSSAEQRRSADERRARCEEARRAEERAREEQRALEQRAREEERARKEREDRCAELAVHLGAGQLAPQDDALAGSAAELLHRLAAGSLQPSDLGPEDPELPCGGTPAAATLHEAWARGVLRSPKAWSGVEDPSPMLSGVLVQHSAELPDEAKFTLLARADEAARQALSIGAPARLGRAVKLCELKVALGLHEGLSCSSLLAIAREKAGSSGR